MTFRSRRSERDEPYENEGRFHDDEEARHFAARDAGQSSFAQRGQSHEERMRDDDSRQRFPARGYRAESYPGQGYPSRSPVSEAGPRRGYEGAGYGRGDYSGTRASTRASDPHAEPPTVRREGFYGSGGSYGYGGGFEHGGKRGYEDEYRSGGYPGPGNEEFYEATGGFGYDVSGYGREGLGFPGRAERRYGGVPGGGVHQAGGRRYFHEDENRAAAGRGYFEEDARRGYTQHGGYVQSGGGRLGQGAHVPAQPSDVRGQAGGLGAEPGTERPRFRGPKGYIRSDERIREELCERLGHGEADPSEVTVSVADGMVTLEGVVASRYDKYQIEELAEAVVGVKEVDSRLRIRRVGTAEEPRSEASASRATPGASGNGARNN